MSLFVATPQPMAAPRAAFIARDLSWSGLAELIALYVLTPAVGFVLLVAEFRAGLLAQLDVLFYRGLVLIVLAFAFTVALGLAARRRGHGGIRRRDVVSAAAMSLSLNLSFLVLFPVTVDRSISVFMLGEMTAHADRAYSSAEMSRVFTDVYVGDYRQIDRRLHEQLLSGNVERAPGGYRISPRGARFIGLSRLVAWMFDSDTRFVSPPGR